MGVFEELDGGFQRWEEIQQVSEMRRNTTKRLM
jgi:hypothetical protein